MCRNIKTLYNFEPTATEEEIKAASIQFVRKITGFNKPSKVNEDEFNRAIEEIVHISQHLLNSLHTDVKSKNREIEREKAKIRNQKRFGII